MYIFNKSVSKCPFENVPKNGVKISKSAQGNPKSLNHLVTLERGHLSWFWYPTHDIGTYLGRGVRVILGLVLGVIIGVVLGMVLRKVIRKVLGVVQWLVWGLVLWMLVLVV